jgi:hypothetical protein
MSEAPADAGLAHVFARRCLLTSVVEGVPNAMIEAQSAGRPVVTVDLRRLR